MKSLKELTERFVKEEKEFMNACMKQADVEDIMEMDETTYRLLKQAFGFMNAANELLIEQASVLDDMDAKINRIVTKIEA